MEKLMDYIRANIEEAVRLEELLVPLKALAPEYGGEGEASKCKVLEDYLKAHGIGVAFGTIEHYDCPDSRVACGIRPNMLLTIKGQTERALWFIVHLDVVPVGDESLWEYEPWRATRVGDLIYGRGVEDNQQGLCSALMAVLGLKDRGLSPYYTTHVLFCSDEEVGSKCGVLYLLEHYPSLFHKEDLIVIPDGGDSEGLCIEIAEKSVLWLRVVVTGKQAHGSRPDTGNNALLAASDLLVSINSLEKQLDIRDPLFTPDYSTIEPTLKEAGAKAYNIIPACDISGIDCRILPCYSIEDIKDRLRDKANIIEARYGVKVSYTVIQETSSPAAAKDCKAVVALSEAIRLMKAKEPKLIGIGGGTVAATLRAQGYTNTVVWSTLDEKAHSTNEYSKISNIASDAMVMASLMLDNKIGG